MSTKLKLSILENNNVLATNKVFMSGYKAIDLCFQYKYLGLMLEEHINFEVTAKHVSKSAQKALGLLIDKNKVQGGFLYDIFQTLYDAMVNSIIEY